MQASPRPPEHPDLDRPAPRRSAWDNRGVRVILAVPVLYLWIIGIALLIANVQSFGTAAAPDLHDAGVADVLFSAILLAVASLGLAVLVLWRRQPVVARVLLAVTGGGVVLLVVAGINVMFHIRNF